MTESKKQSAPYGSWESPITASLLTSAGVSLSQVEVGRGCVYWCEGRPNEGGRVVIVKQTRDGATSDVTPPGFNVRTRAHEYGGGAYTTHGDAVYFCNFADQRMYRQDGDGACVAITPEPPQSAAWRYADARVTPDGRTIICVSERHEAGSETTNALVAFPSDGSAAPRTIASGHDFFASPRISPDGTRLAWITWDHPNMPWDGSELWVGLLDGQAEVFNLRCVAGGSSESVVQPEWSPEGVLHFVSDKSGWWNLYSERRSWVAPLLPMDAEFGLPHWVFGLSRYAFLSDERVACIYGKDGFDHLAILNFDGAWQECGEPGASYADLRSDGDHQLYFIAGSPSTPNQVVTMDTSTGHQQVIKISMQTDLDVLDISIPEPIEFPTATRQVAFALFYRPTNRQYRGAEAELPPLLVLSHGGPTSAANSTLKLGIQYWTSRGFAVVDVNYGGSTGYGREYRERLNGQWGIVDVDDCIAAARHLAGRGDVDAKRMCIRGGSAGGYTTLCALVFHDVFAAGASHYGVADLTALATDTHKFEARYLDRLIGPYPQAEAVYRARSPIHFADRMSCPVILFQGGEDKVVPPNQAETFVAALRAKQLPCEYILFPEEGHGFRQAANIQHAAEAELQFYLQVFGVRLL